MYILPLLSILKCLSGKRCFCPWITFKDLAWPAELPPSTQNVVGSNPTWGSSSLLLGKRGVRFRRSCLALPCLNEWTYMYMYCHVVQNPLKKEHTSSPPLSAFINPSLRPSPPPSPFLTLRGLQLSPCLMWGHRRAECTRMHRFQLHLWWPTIPQLVQWSTMNKHMTCNCTCSS